MVDKNFLLMFHLAKKCGLNQSCSTSTLELANEFGGSQQTISRKLRELEQCGFIERFPFSSGTELVLTPKASQYFKNHMKDVEALFETFTSDKNITGVIQSGLGEGAYYVSLPQYRRQFKQFLGFTPFPGTLNVRVEGRKFEKFLEGEDPIFIEGFESRKRSFGGINCYRAKIGSYKQAVIIIPERSSHKGSVLEIISPDFLRERLSLEDGKKLKISI